MMVAAILWACLLAGPAEGDTSDDAFVRAVAQRVAEVMHDEKYAAALAEIEKAERERPLPDFVFMRAKVEETRGNCVAAVSLYGRFLETEPRREDAEAARAGRARCGAKDDGATSNPAPAPVSAVERPERPWYADPGGGALVIGGTVAIGVGLGLFVQARADERSAERADTLEQHERLGDRSRKLGIAAVSVLAAGGALVLGGVVRYVVVGRRARKAERRVTLGSDLRIHF
jgi:hypothetical protein